MVRNKTKILYWFYKMIFKNIFACGNVTNIKKKKTKRQVNTRDFHTHINSSYSSSKLTFNHIIDHLHKIHKISSTLKHTDFILLSSLSRSRF